MKQKILKEAFYEEVQNGKKYLKENDYSKAFYHFENAHILGQKHLLRHTKSHIWMFYVGIKMLNFKEVFGQLFRIVASVLFTLIWVPKGNTGGSNISAIQRLPIRKELQKFFN